MTIRFCDLDDVELKAALEDAFGIALPDSELQKCSAFGELFDCVAERVNHSRGGACLSALAFRRLRKALEAAMPSGTRVKPSTRLSELAPAGGWRNWRRALESESGLDLPALPTVAMVPWGLIGWVSLFASAAGGPLSCALGVNSALVPAMAMACFLALAMTLRRPQPEATVADLIRAAAPFNAGRLAKAGRPLRTADVWACVEALTRIHGDCSGLIDRRTRFEHVWP